MSRLFWPDRATSRIAQMCLAAFIVLAVVGMCLAMPMRGGRRPAGKGNVNLPTRVGNVGGGDWYIYPGGMIRQQNNMPLVSQGNMLTVDGNGINQNNNQARVEANGELVLENLPVQNVTVTRRILYNNELGYFRIIDVLKNPQGQEANVQYAVQNSFNYGLSGSTPINYTPSKGGDIQIGTTIQDGQNRTAVGIYCGRKFKVLPVISADQNQNSMGFNVQLTIPPNKEVAVIHFFAPGGDPAKLQKILTEGKAIADVPRDIRRELVNFTSSRGIGDSVYGSALDDQELLRGDLFDVVELRGGDQYRGTLSQRDYKLDTAYGTLDVAAESVLGALNLGDARPRQLLVLRDGQIFSGHLEGEKIPLVLSGGQTTQVPLSQVSRLGYRGSASEDEDDQDSAFTRPMVYLRSGDRIAVSRPTDEIPFVTRYGMLRLKPESVAAVVMANPEYGVHQVILNDGSHFVGLLANDAFDLKFAPAEMPSEGSGGSATTLPDKTASTGSANRPARAHYAALAFAGQAVKFPVSGIARLQLSAPQDEADSSEPTLRLANDDVLVGTISGDLKIDTTFDTLSLKGEQIKGLTPLGGPAGDVQVKMADDTVVSGHLEATELEINLTCGLMLKTPMSLVVEFRQPYPMPSEAILERAKEAIKNLNDNDWKLRDRAQAELLRMGAMVVPVLKEMRPSQPEESKQRIDEIISTLKSAAESHPASGAGGGGGGAAPMPINAQQMDVIQPG